MLFYATNKILVIQHHVQLMMDVFSCFPASLTVSISASLITTRVVALSIQP